MLADLALTDQRLAASMDELDRILDRDDVTTPGIVDLVDQCRQRRGFAGPGLARNQHDTAGVAGEVVQYLGQAEIFQRGLFLGDDPEYRADAADMTEHIDPEASKFRDLVGEVRAVILLELRLGVGAHDLIQRLCQPVRIKCFLPLRQGGQRAVDPHSRRLSGQQMQVRPAVADGGGQQVGEVNRHDESSMAHRPVDGNAVAPLPASP